MMMPQSLLLRRLVVVVIGLISFYWTPSVGSFVIVTPPHSNHQPRLSSPSSPHSLIVVKPLWFSSTEAATALSQVADDDNEKETEPILKAETENDDTSSASSSVSMEQETQADEDDQDGKKLALKRDRNTLFVGNLPFDKSETEIRDLFAEYGKVELVNIPRNRNSGDPRGFAFVDMSTDEEVQAAIAALNGYMLGDRAIRVIKSLPKNENTEGGGGAGPRVSKGDAPGTKKIYVGNIPFETTQDEITAHYEQFGTVLEAYIPVDRKTGTGRGFAFVTMKEEDAESAIEQTNGSEFQGRKLVVNIPLPPGEKAPMRNASPKNRSKLYVGNLSFYTIADTLMEAFSEFGTVHDCYLPEDPNTGASRGFGFVTMDKEDAVRAVAELDGCEIDGRIVRVNEAQPKMGGPRLPRKQQREY